MECAANYKKPRYDLIPGQSETSIRRQFHPDNTPGTKYLSAINISMIIFFHPDCTVGFGVSPNHALRLVGCTTGRELHPALKILIQLSVIIDWERGDVKIFILLFTTIEERKQNNI